LPSEKLDVEWVICPAACQVLPLVSSAFSSSTTSRPPALMRQVIGQADPHDAAADDDHAGVAGKLLSDMVASFAFRVAKLLDRLSEHVYHRQS
jgi:hypothetical protein